MKPEDNNYVDSLLLSSSAPSNTSGYNEDDADYYTEHDTRKRDISLNDIVHKVSLNEYFQGKLQGWSQFVGETTYVNTLGNLDVETRDTLKEYITLWLKQFEFCLQFISHTILQPPKYSFRNQQLHIVTSF